MGKTSTEVKRRYNEKTYKRWFADLRNEDFDRIEALRGEQSRAAFLKTVSYTHLCLNGILPLDFIYLL